MPCYLFIFFLVCFANAQKRFQPEYFINKHNLKLPTITKGMLNVSDYTHTSDSWEYYYKGKTEKLDSVVEYLTIEGFQSSRTNKVYSYSNDTAFVRVVSIRLKDGDTLVNGNDTFTNNFRYQSAIDLETNCIYHSKFDERGIKLLDVSKCTNENEFYGQVFYLNAEKEYLQKYRKINSEIDSNSIRRYYLTPFDSIAADYMVKKGEEPFVVRLNIYNNKNKKQTSYSFDIFSKTHEVFDFDYYSYSNNNDLHRVYHFQVKNSKAKIREYELVNYTEYEYDKLGRKTTMITRVRPDPKYQKND